MLAHKTPALTLRPAAQQSVIPGGTATTAVSPELPTMIRHMLEPRFYPHPVETPIRLEQTHISYVLLTGEHAYKVKKPVSLGFLDFSTLERRRYFCLEELRLNRRHAPDLYLDVLPISIMRDGSYHLGDSTGQVIDYAVHMRQFPSEQLFGQLFTSGKLEPAQLIALGQEVASVHQGAHTDAHVQQYGSPQAIRQVADDNYQATVPFIGRVQTLEQFTQTRAFTDAFFRCHADWLVHRQRTGAIRECHGDLHLNNVCRYQGKIQLFDCIEFSEAFRNIDVIYDVAFMVMDLEYRGRRDLAYAFLNAYLEQTGDYWGAVLLPLYMSMRASVRAKVNALLLDEPGVPSALQARAAAQTRAYYQLAWAYGRPRQGRIVLMAGASGSGKSTVARYLAQQLGALHIRADAVRKHLAGLPLDQRGTAELYTPAMTERTYTRMLELGLLLAQQGQIVILDAKNDRQAMRTDLIALAAGSRLPVHILHCRAPRTVLEERLRIRPPDVSDATPNLVAAQLQAAEPWTAQEQLHVVQLDTTEDWQLSLAPFIDEANHSRTILGN